ncbi:MAG: zinc ribbon domain-containing protein [Candidatus Bathyarchaeia archaeon]
MDKKLILGLAVTIIGLVMFTGSLQHVQEYGYMAPLTMSIILIGGLAFTVYSFRSGRAPVIKERERIVMNVAKKHAGIVTRSLLVYESGLSLKDAKGVLDRFVKYGEAEILEMGGAEFYDIPTARSSLSKIENEIIRALLKTDGIASKTLLTSQLGYSPAAVDEAIKGLTDQRVVEYDSESGICELLGVFKSCPYCKAKIPIDVSSCPKCGAQLEA